MQALPAGLQADQTRTAATQAATARPGQARPPQSRTATEVLWPHLPVNLALKDDLEPRPSGPLGPAPEPRRGRPRARRGLLARVQAPSPVTGVQFTPAATAGTLPTS